MISSFSIGRVVIQPTNFCNIDCRYCYLPGRENSNSMSYEVAEAIAHRIREHSEPVHLMWHGGEPLSIGLRKFSRLFSYFCENIIAHSVQTNGTLVDDEWAKFFKEKGVSVSVSIDGPKRLNSQRVDRSKNHTFDRALKGLKVLQAHGIKVPVLAVVTEDSINSATELYQFCVENKIEQLAINMLEVEGVNKAAINDEGDAYNYWSELCNVWLQDKRVSIREINDTLHAIRFFSKKSVPSRSFDQLDLIPTITTKGDIVLLSPELAGIKSNKYKDFVVGNVLYDSFSDIIARAPSIEYVSDYILGLEKCRSSCSHYFYCRGGRASNKFAEHGATNASETKDCRITIKALTNAVIEQLELYGSKQNEVCFPCDKLWKRIREYDLSFLVRVLIDSGVSETEEEAEILILEFKKYTYIVAKSGQVVYMTSRSVDDVWHNLILSGKYQDYSNRIFGGEFFHHPCKEDVDGREIRDLLYQYSKYFGKINNVWFEDIDDLAEVR